MTLYRACTMVLGWWLEEALGEVQDFVFHMDEETS